MFGIVYMFILGCVMGSFYYVVGTRLSQGKSLIKPRSHCEECNHVLGVFDLIPVLSYIMLRGKCRYCHKKISLKYLLYELFTGILFALSYYKFGVSYNFFISLIISSLVILIFITDFNEMIILDSPLIISSILVFILKLIFLGYKEAIFSIFSGFLIFLIMYLMGYLGKIVFKKDALGGGDIKFMFVVGEILSFQYALTALILSTFLALPYAVASLLLNKENELPFGPFLVSSLFIIFYFLEKFKYIFYLFV